MKALAQVGENLLVLFMGTVSAAAGFGLLLGLAWLPAFSQSSAYRLTSLLLVTVLALLIGGWVSGLLVHTGRVRRAAALGAFSGILAFGYIFGPNLVLLLTVPTASLVAGIGGWLAARSVRVLAKVR